MNHTRRIMSAAALLLSCSLAINAGNITANTARTVANNFVKQQTAAAPGTFRGATATSDLMLAHAEPSSAVTDATDYYAFNIKGGGFIIIAGEDRAVQVLGYSDKGRFNTNNLPAPLQDLLNGYKKEIEFLQTYKGDDLIPAPVSFNASNGVEPLIKTTWGQEMPYYLQCPTYQGEYCVVGCVATAMAQVMNYWQYPTSSAALGRYYSYGYGYVPALPATTFDYSLMLDSYCHWDWDNSQLVQDTYTDAQAQEVAKLSRYCGQAAEMEYSPEGSGAYTWDQLDAMISFGYSSDARDISKGGDGGWGSSYSNYTTAQWEALIKTELDAGRPILYSANDPSAGGHAFICDGYNSSGYFHFNYGWYGTCDGWYLSTSLKMTHRDGEALNFSSGHEMLIYVEPPTYCILNTDGIQVNGGLMVLGEAMNADALNVNLRTSYNSVNLQFALTDGNGNNVCNSNTITINKNNFVQGSTVGGTLTLPASLEEGCYGIKLYNTTGNELQAVATATGELQVVGNLAKYDAPFTIADVTATINYLLEGTYPILSIKDVTTLINHLLTH